MGSVALREAYGAAVVEVADTPSVYGNVIQCGRVVVCVEVDGSLQGEEALVLNITY